MSSFQICPFQPAHTNPSAAKMPLKIGNFSKIAKIDFYPNFTTVWRAVY